MVRKTPLPQSPPQQFMTKSHKKWYLPEAIKSMQKDDNGKDVKAGAPPDRARNWKLIRILGTHGLNALVWPVQVCWTAICFDVAWVADWTRPLARRQFFGEHSLIFRNCDAPIFTCSMVDVTSTMLNVIVHVVCAMQVQSLTKQHKSVGGLQ